MKKGLISPSNLNESLARWNILGCRVFPFISLIILCQSFLAFRVSAENSADSLMGVTVYVTHCFSLAAFNILSSSLIFAILITVCLGVALFELILLGTLCFLDLAVSFYRLGKFSTIIYSDMFSAPLIRQLLTILSPFAFMTLCFPHNTLF